MQYNIFGGNLPRSPLHVEPGRIHLRNPAAPGWMTAGVQMDTNMKGGLLKGLGRMLSGRLSVHRDLFGNRRESGDHHLLHIPRRNRCGQPGGRR